MTISNGQKDLGFSDAVLSKIVDSDDLSDIVGEPPRQRIVVMCHGTFDLVHPGHLRHLAFAKSKGDLLIVSITADAHVTKANMRPYVPEQLRALNLAALELVDLVVVDQNPEPLELLAAIKPDIFVKGFEYENSLPPKTNAEKTIVEAHGGQMIFSPGDFILSSSAVIEQDPPRIGLEKLLTLMQVEGITFNDLHDALRSFQGISVTLVGDIIVDGITTGSIIGGYRKTPTPSVRIESEQNFVGGCGIVAKHIAATRAAVRIISIVGDDAFGRFAIQDLEEAGVKCHIRVSDDRPTTHKSVVIADGYRMIRMDTVDNKTVDYETLVDMTTQLSNCHADAVVFSDFRHGIFNKATIPSFLAAAPRNAFTVGDSQVASRWGNILEFAGCDMLTPNEEEVRFALGDQDSVIRPLGSTLYDQARCKILMLKLGDRGMMTFRAPLEDADRRSFFSVDSLARENILDPVGAGDALLAYATLTQVATGNEAVASIIGTVAAGLECEFEGNVPVSPELVHSRLSELEKASDFR